MGFLQPVSVLFHVFQVYLPEQSTENVLGILGYYLSTCCHFFTFYIFIDIESGVTMAISADWTFTLGTHLLEPGLLCGTETVVILNNGTSVEI